MRSYFSSAACNGHRPAHVSSSLGSYISRPRLLSKMLQNRNALRLIKAPQYFGKTMLVHDYATQVRSYARTYWFQAQSPCFLRDIDSGELCSRMSEDLAQTSLVIFDDVPLMSEERTSSFCEIIDLLLKDGHEVIVSTHPFADVYHAQKDRIVIDASDLLLTDAELKDLLGTPYNSPALNTPSFSLQNSYEGYNQDFMMSADADEYKSNSVCKRVFAVAKGEVSFDDLCESVFSLSVSANYLALFFLMFVFQKGSFYELRNYAKTGVSKEDLRFIARHFPYMGIDLQNESYETFNTSPACLHASVKQKKDILVNFLKLTSFESFLHAASAKLIQEKKQTRALDFLKAFSSKSFFTNWLLSHAFSLALANCIVDPIEHAQNINNVQAKEKKTLAIDNAWRFVFLGDTHSAKANALSCLKESMVSIYTHVSALFLLSVLSVETDITKKQEQAKTFLEKLGIDPHLFEEACFERIAVEINKREEKVYGTDSGAADLSAGVLFLLFYASMANFSDVVHIWSALKKHMRKHAKQEFYASRRNERVCMLYRRSVFNTHE